MLKYLFGVRRDFRTAYNVVSNIYRRHGRSKYCVSIILSQWYMSRRFNFYFFYFFTFIRLLHGNTWTSQSVIELTNESTKL
jgi:hypothetical protein